MDLSMRESVLALVAALGVVMAAGASVLELRVGASDADGWKAAKAKLVGTVFVDKTVERRITDRNLSAKEDQQ